MRIVVKEYANGGRGATETTEDGGEVIQELAGPRKVGARLCAFIEVFCDNTDEGIERLLEGMAWLTAEIEKRKGPFSEKKKPARRKVAT